MVPVAEKQITHPDASLLEKSGKEEGGSNSTSTATAATSIPDTSLPAKSGKAEEDEDESMPDSLTEALCKELEIDFPGPDSDDHKDADNDEAAKGASGTGILAARKTQALQSC